jgi:hypothetical protein
MPNGESYTTYIATAWPRVVCTNGFTLRRWAMKSFAAIERKPPGV